MEQAPLRYTDLVSPDWFSTFDNSSIWVTAHRILRIRKYENTPKPSVLNFPGSKAIVLFGVLNYFDLKDITYHYSQDHNPTISMSGPKPSQKTTQQGWWLLFILPFRVDGKETPENEIRYKVDILTALFAACNGRNIVYERVFDNVVQMKDGTVTCFSPSNLNPFSFPIPDIEEKGLLNISKVTKRIASLGATEKNRIELSLHWFNTAVLLHTGTDSFIKFWIALEVLEMPDTTNILPINENLSKAYGLTINKTKNYFGVGKLFGLRSQIVHEGKYIPIEGLLLDYMEAIYVDVLFEHLSLPIEKRAELILHDINFKLDKLLHLT